MLQPPGPFACRACGKIHAWDPRYVGQVVRCACGHEMQVVMFHDALPEPAPTEDELVEELTEADLVSPDPDESPGDDLYELAPPTRPAPARPSQLEELASAVAPTLAYAGPPPPVRRSLAEQEAHRASRVTDLYAPLALIVVGVVLSFVDAAARGLRTPGVATLYVILSITMNLALILPALMLATRLLDLGLGLLWTAMLKIAAVAILPGAVAGILSVYTFGLLTWGISLLGYYAILAYLFEMDGREIRITTMIIWCMRFIVNLLIVGVVLSALLNGRKPPSAALAAGSTPGSGLIPPAAGVGLSDDGDSPEDADAAAEQMVASPRAVEARKWCTLSPDSHIALQLNAAQLADLVEKFYAAGAVRVWCAKISSLGEAQLCPELIVELPHSPGARRAALDVSDRFSHQASPTPDNGARYLTVNLAGFHD